MKTNSISVKKLEDKFIPEIVELWNTLCRDEVLYKPLTIDGFKGKFIDNSYFDYEGTFILLENDIFCGFASGIYRKDYLPGQTFENTPGYITMVMVKKDKRGRGYGRLLVENVEKYLKDIGKKFIRIEFFNPINLEWIIPGTLNHDHPNTPGVDTNSDAYGFFKKIGYIERAVEVSMYNDLGKFELSNNINRKYKKLCEEGFSIEMYDADKHKGLDSFFDNLKNEYWRKEIIDNLALEAPHPFLVAVKEGKICGFAGPLEIEESGRGRFSGIGVDPGFEGKGLGTLLFFMLCYNFKQIGAAFMSLFTGENGNARKIYGSAGFEVVRRWALFNKEL